MTLDKQALDGLRIDRSAAARRRLPLVPILAVLASVAVIGGALWWWLGRPQAPVVRTIVLQAMASQQDKTLLNASGYVTARRAATVSSKVTGKVVEVLVEEGMRVKAGQVLARIDASNVEKSLELAKAQSQSARRGLDETKVNLERAQRELRRLNELALKHMVSESALDRADADAKSLQARLQRQQADVSVAEREVAIWRQQLDDTIIRAPFAGIVTSKDAQPGEMISPMSSGGFTRTGICTIVDMSSLEIEVDVNESYINRVAPGQAVEATLDSYPQWRIPARVIAIIPTADRQKATVKVRVGFEKLDPRVLPDMSVKVAFQHTDTTPAAAQGIVVPKAAIHQRDGRDVVWLVREGRVERRAVKVASANGDEVIVAAGVNGGDRVVIEGAGALLEGTRVREAQR